MSIVMMGSRGHRDQMLELEEEFDLFKLGFVSERSTGGDIPAVSTNDKVPSVVQIESAPEFKPVRPSLGWSRSNSKAGRYVSADWFPAVTSTLDNERTDIKTEDCSTPASSPGQQEQDVLVHDFAPHPVAEQADANEAPKPITHLRGEALLAALFPIEIPDNVSIRSTPSLDAGILTSTETTTATPSLSARKPRNFKAELITIRRPGRRGGRVGIRIKRRPTSVSDQDVSDLEIVEEPVTPEIPPPDSKSLREILESYGRDHLDKINLASKRHNTSGDLLPSILRDLFPALSDWRQAVQLSNEIRTNFQLPLLSTRMDRVALHKSLAQMRERLYLELAGALILPLAPPELPPVTPDEERMSMSLTPSSFETLSRTLPKAFHSDRSTIKSCLNHQESTYGEEGDVVWIGGVGRMKRKLKEGQYGYGFRGEEGEGLVHIFVDHSNILYGLLHHLFSSTLPLPPKHQRILSLPCLSLLLGRGRAVRSAHAVTSSPLHQDMDPLVRLNWEVSILKRVEIYESEVNDASAAKLTPRPAPRTIGGGVGGGTRRYKEQGVDEVLTLKMLQTINRVPVEKGSTMVLATGDARGGQFNKEGFLGAVREAVGRGWNMELWSFSSGLSRAWKDTARREGWDGKFRIYTMDEWAGELIEVNEEAE